MVIVRLVDYKSEYHCLDRTCYIHATAIWFNDSKIDS